MKSVTLQRRTWLLSLLSFANKAGIDPLPKNQLHSLIFFANCLAPIYEEVAHDARVIKHDFGPFYPDAQWDIDRMVAQGLISVSGIRYRRISLSWWMDSDYRISSSGTRVQELSLTTPVLARTSNFIKELTETYASMSVQTADEAFLYDAIYETPAMPTWASLVFDSVDKNLSVLTAEAFDQFLPSGHIFSSRERVELYLQYLKERASKRDAASAETVA
ncbi:MAG: hypothetical protein Q7K57_52220 [Burkholderiaceae bacterium]|nr:hypothetical protein [Burkholderiaceae bacterium]